MERISQIKTEINLILSDNLSLESRLETLYFVYHTDKDPNTLEKIHALQKILDHQKECLSHYRQTVNLLTEIKSLRKKLENN